MKICHILGMLLSAIFVLCSTISPTYSSSTSDNNFSHAVSYTPGDPVSVSDIPVNMGKKAFKQQQDGREAVILPEVESWAEWKIEVPKQGEYCLRFDYYPLKGKKADLTAIVQIDGQPGLDKSKEFTLPRRFNAGGQKITRDKMGNDIAPQRVEFPGWLTDYERQLGDYSDGWHYSKLEAGTHTIRVVSNGEPFAISSVSLCPKVELPSYEEYKGNNSKEGKTDGDAIIIEGEDTASSSQAFLRPISDRSSPFTTPYHPNLIRMNTFGGSAWRYPGQSVTWDVNIKESGYYKIAFRYKQNFVRGFFTTRTLEIDGIKLFADMNDVRFPYDTSFKLKVLGDDKPCEIYLEAGKHTFTMEASLGVMSEYLKIIDESIRELNTIYRHIVMVTGIKPDLYRDYELEKVIPELKTTFTKTSGILRDTAEKIEGISASKGSEAASMVRLAEELESLVKEPETIPARLERFKTNISSLQAWLLAVSEQPLELDKFYVTPVNEKFPKAEPGFLGKMVHEIRSFVGSFFTDYDSIGSSVESKRNIKVWVSTGRDQASILRRLADENFTAKTGIGVNLSLVQGALQQAVMAGEGPDVALNVGRGDPVNMGIRNAVVDLNEFKELPEISARFKGDALLPYAYKGKCYGLPETQTFHMMFYREDIFKELGIDPPKTWDDLIDMIPVIQGKNMGIGLPYVKMDAYAVVNTGLGAQSLFPTLLMQRGGTLYNKQLDSTELDSSTAYSAFKTWVNFYTQYGFTLIKDDYSRFRTGEMPLIITGYNFYNQLSIGAPEIRGLWKMTGIPGTRKDDGSIDRTEGASGTACMIFNSTTDKEACWEFIKWWTSAEAQTDFGNELEILLGPAGRYNTANVEAFEMLPWSMEEIKNIESQWDAVKELPEIPGGYYTSRNIDNAFRKVILQNENSREALYYWNRETNLEIGRKLKEFDIQ